MKKAIIRLSALLLALLFAFTGCRKSDDPEANTGDTQTESNTDGAYGPDLSETGAYDGYFEEDVAEITISCISGTQNSYRLEGNTLTFTEISEDSVYAVSGRLKGNIVIDVGDSYKFDLELQGLSLVCDSTSPILIKSGDEVSLTAKKDHQNYIYDTRAALDGDDTGYAGAIYSLVDLEICGKGALTLVSEHNNGIHGKDDLQVKNLTLFVYCVDNALKGNDSVEIKNATTTLIATAGDGIKTTNSDISSKGNQRGTVSITGGTHTVYAACDGIDAAYNVVIDDSTTVLSVYTDRYSSYSTEVTANNEALYYIRFTSNNYKYSVKYYNSEEDYTFVNASYDSAVSGGRSTYYYYSFPKNSAYSKLKFFIYSADMSEGQEESYLAASDYLTPSTAYDTIALTSTGSGLSYAWTNYTTTPTGGMGGMGGMQDGNTDKGDHSTKGIKAANEISILAGTVTVHSYDDAIHANKDTTLENGATPTGNVTISGGDLTLYSNDDGIHADGTLTVSGGTVRVAKSYEGLEGTNINITGGSISVIASDDGINGTATTGTAIAISGGSVYIYCTGDGLDSNSRSSYTGIVFSGGTTVVIANSNGNSAIDTEAGYSYTGGTVLAVMPSGGMTGEATNCQNFQSIGTSKNLSLASGAYLSVTVAGSFTVAVQLPVSLSGRVIYLGSSNASVATQAEAPGIPDENGVVWG